MAIYNQTDIPVIGGRSLSIPTGFETQIAINYVENTKLDKNQGGQCVYESDSKIDYYQAKERTFFEFSKNRKKIRSAVYC